MRLAEKPKPRSYHQLGWLPPFLNFLAGEPSQPPTFSFKLLFSLLIMADSSSESSEYLPSESGERGGCHGLRSGAPGRAKPMGAERRGLDKRKPDKKKLRAERLPRQGPPGQRWLLGCSQNFLVSIFFISSNI